MMDNNLETTEDSTEDSKMIRGTTVRRDNQNLNLNKSVLKGAMRMVSKDKNILRL
jgi:hypothetical protein